MQHNTNFNWADAWILSAMMVNVKEETNVSTKISLTDIIAAADWINHAILTNGELDEGLLRLMQAGYITTENYQFLLTELVLPLYLRFTKSRRGILEKVKMVEKHLQSKPWDSNYIPNSKPIHGVISEADYEKAIQGYRQMWKGK